MMLRLRSRAATLMADRSSHQSPPPTPTPHTNQIPSLLTSPRLRAIFAAGAHSNYYSDQAEASPTTANSPTSVLPFSAAALGSPIRYHPPPPPTKTVTKPPCRKSSDLGLNSLILENSDDDVSKFHFSAATVGPIRYNPPPPPTTTVTKPPCRKSSDLGLNCIILKNSDADVSKFRQNLTVRIPIVPDSPTEFGIKTWNSPKPRKRSDQKCLSTAEMELSEEYTCVISHGPNPTTTHIYDDHIVVESCIFYLSDDCKPTTMTALTEVNDHRSSESFLSACFTCRKSLKQNQDIYIYRGDKAFCSSHCRYQEMVFDGSEDEEDK